MSYLNKVGAVALAVSGLIMVSPVVHVRRDVLVSGYSHFSRVSFITESVGSRNYRARKHHRVRLPRDYQAWSKVAVCEEGGWIVHDGAGNYPDSLGIDRANYVAFGGKPQPTGVPNRKERVEQIKVADRLIRHYGIGIPDQNGCDGSW
jgi:hypothetical protein